MEAPNSLAFESVKLRSVYINKKRYASLEILSVLKGETTAQAILRGKVNYKGLESKRRDNAFIGSETQLHCLKLILKDGNVEAAAEFVKKTISDLLMNRVDISKLIISKGLSKTEEEYAKGGTKQIHVELTKRITKRSRYTGEIPADTGDRVAYIMTAGTIRKSGKGASKAFELAEDPLVAMEKGAPINVNYYIEKQIMAATLRVFTCIWEPERCKEVKSTMSKKVLRTLVAYQRLFQTNLPHMLQRSEPKNSSYGIGAFTVPLPKCLKPGCRKRARREVEVVCDEHDAKDALAGVKEEYAKRVKRNEERWETCRKCAGGGFDEVTCSNVICENFFARRRTQLDIADVERDLGKFKRARVTDIEDLAN